MKRLTVACATFVAGMAASAFPFFRGRAFDANELVLSNLLSRSENPHGYAAAALAAVVCAALLWPLVRGWMARAGLVAMAAVGVLSPVEEMYGQPHILLAFAAFILMTAGLAASASRWGALTGSPWWIALAALGWLILAFLFYLLVTPGYFHHRRGWRGLAFCEWALCAWIVLQIGLLNRSRHVTIEVS